MVNKKQEMERFIFERFASISDLELDLATIKQPGPPEPDISCVDVHGRTYAFELVLITLEEMMESTSSDQILIEELKSALKNLDPPYNNSALGITFTGDLGKREKKNFVKIIIEEVKKLDVGFSGNITLPDDLKNDLLLCIAVRPDLTAPILLISGPFGAIGHPPIHAELRIKLIEKTYETTAERLELLAYYNGFPAFFEFAGLQIQMQDFVNTLLKNSRFKRVWIFDASNQRVILKVP
jgi:hypothetical protein